MAYNRNIFVSGTTKYKDVDISFKPHPLTGDIRTKSDLDAIKQSLKNLLFTNFGERPFQHNLYGNLNNLLFEPLDDIVIEELKKSITTVINNFEPRIRVIYLDVKGGIDENEVSVTIQFNMINIIEPQTIKTILKRVR